MPRLVQREIAVARDEITLVQLRGEIVYVNDIPGNDDLGADFRDRHGAEFQVRAVNRELAVGLSICRRDLTGNLDRAGDSIWRILRPVIAQLDRAYRH